MASTSKKATLLSAALLLVVIAACVIVMQRDGRVSTGPNLKGAINSTRIGNNETRAELPPGICLVSLIDIEIDDTVL